MSWKHTSEISSKRTVDGFIWLHVERLKSGTWAAHVSVGEGAQGHYSDGHPDRASAQQVTEQAARDILTAALQEL